MTTYTDMSEQDFDSMMEQWDRADVKRAVRCSMAKAGRVVVDRRGPRLKGERYA